MKRGNNMNSQPFYHLRPNKYIDRNLFLQTLIGLNQFAPISEYQYTGFGSYLFDDFKLLHEILNISTMISLEKDPVIYARARFNCPYNCIEIRNEGSTEYLSSLSLTDTSHNIFWLDYTDPKSIGTQLADYSILLGKLNTKDIVRITLNANPSTLGKSSKDADELREKRLVKLQERVPNEFIPSMTTPDDLTKTHYPLLILKILKNVAMDVLQGTKYEPNYLFPLFSSVYEDGQQMLTFTGIVLDKCEDETKIQDALQSHNHHSFSWDNPCSISIPALSIRELYELNKILPSETAKEQLLHSFPFVFGRDGNFAVDSYISYYKHYPNFHQVNF